jgi:hypothetical protein
MDLNSSKVKKTTGRLTAAQERTGTSGNADNSRTPELVETPERQVSNSRDASIIRKANKGRDHNNCWDQKNTNRTNNKANNRVNSNSRGRSQAILPVRSLNCSLSLKLNYE